VGLGFRLTFNLFYFSLALLFFAVFSGLSVWQVNRALEKQERAELIEWANNEAPLTITRLTDEFLLSHLFYRATASGRFQQDQCFYVENVIRAGEPGLYVYCPYQVTDDERWLLVNMGWLKRRGDRLDLPDYRIDSDSGVIGGVIKQPRSKPVVIAGDGKPNSERDHLWSYFDFDVLKTQSGLDFYPIELQLSSEVDGLLLREWPEYEPKTGMHIGYAIHWGGIICTRYPGFVCEV